jgi:hypothetical protein
MTASVALDFPSPTCWGGDLNNSHQAFKNRRDTQRPLQYEFPRTEVGGYSLFCMEMGNSENFTCFADFPEASTFGRINTAD